MKFLDQFRDPVVITHLLDEISRIVTRSWTIMEICGGQTRNIVRYGLQELLPVSISLVHGPGCPVCVIPETVIDQAIGIAEKYDVILCTFGDMLRVPGSTSDLFSAKACGADVRVVYSPLDALNLAMRHRMRSVVLLAVGFETTAPAVAVAVAKAVACGVHNFYVLVAHVTVPPAMTAILANPRNRVQGVLGAGHVCAVTGETEYVAIADRFRVPIVISGFEPFDILQSILICVRQLECGSYGVINQYARVVRDRGNIEARRLVAEVFELRDFHWRGLGELASSGLALKSRYAHLDARQHFTVSPGNVSEPGRCQAGKVLTGMLKPSECGEFGRTCTPKHPLGAPMVSREGACAAYFHTRGSR